MIYVALLCVVVSGASARGLNRLCCVTFAELSLLWTKVFKCAHRLNILVFLLWGQKNKNHHGAHKPITPRGAL